MSVFGRADERPRFERRSGSGWMILVLLLVSGLAGCQRREEAWFQGYVEAEWVRVGSPLGGTLERLAVRRGDTVTAGQPLFALERAAEEAALREGEGRLAQARARLEDLRKGRRPSEVASLEARLAQVKASLTFTAAEAARWEQLGKQGVASESELERARAARDRDARLADELEAELATARLGARSDAIAAAEAEVSSLEEGRVRLAWSVEQKRWGAPVGALVQDTYYLEGEWVAPGSPVVALLPPGNLKVRFFIPEPKLGTVRVGDRVRVRVDGGEAAGYAARVSFVSPQAEYTPPVIYSRENRAKLVFMAEAVFEAPEPGRLHPGQPAEVHRVAP